VYGVTARGGAADTDIDDIAVRLQFAYYTADARSMKDAIEVLAGSKQPPELAATRDYYLAYGQWKLAEILSVTDKRESARAAHNCETAAQAAAADMAHPEEAFALQAACSDAGHALDITGRAAKLVQKALTLDAKNPRVLLIDALRTDVRHSGAKSAAGADRCAKLQNAVQSFESAPVAKPGDSDWGYAEALARFAQCLINAGDHVNARNALEKSLVIAPDYRWARELLHENSAS
jgi:tetratricopeptide (TPR) repeat protein